MEKALKILLLVAGILTLPAILPRLAYDRPGPVALVVDGRALAEEAAHRGASPTELLRSYRSLGVTGIAFYEERVEERARKGLGAYLEGGMLRLLAPEVGFLAGWYYTDVPGASAIPLPQHRVVWRGKTWIGFPKDVARVPLGPPAELEKAYRLGFWIAYRPENHPLHPWPPALPPQAGLFVFAGTEALGYPDRLPEVAERLSAPIALIEGTRQAGVAYLAKRVGAIRLFSLRGEYQLKLAPEVAARKYVLAARERSHRVLYFRPYPTPGETERFLEELRRGLSAAGIPLGVPEPRRFSPSPFAAFAWLGAAAGLLLYLWRLPRGLALPLGLLLLVIAFGYGRDQAGPLLVALVFPVLGFLEPTPGLRRWGYALAYALLGALFLTALGSREETLLGLSAFRGVGLLLLVPPFLYLLGILPKRDWKRVVESLLAHRLRLGEAALAGFLLFALIIAFFRRGNDAPFISVLELTLRDQLQALMIRPRFKEVFGHAAAVFALTAGLPRWITLGLLAFAVIAEASILNSFAHYHTPFSVSLARTLNGALIGGMLGGIGWLIYRGIRRWWSA